MKRPLWVLGLSFAAAQIAASAVGLNAALTLAALCLVALLCRLFLPVLRRNGVLLAALLTGSGRFLYLVRARRAWLSAPLPGWTARCRLCGPRWWRPRRKAAGASSVCWEGGIPKGRKLLLRPAYGEDLPGRLLGDRGAGAGVRP